MKETTDDHLPPPPGETRGGGEKKAPSAPAGAAPAPFVWGDRILFAAGGVLLGFAAAYGYLEKVRTPAPQAAAMPADPHAGLPGFGPAGGGEGRSAAAPISADPVVRQRLKEMQLAVEKAPNDYDLLVHLGNAAFDADEAKLAVDAYERALKIKPGDPNVLTDLGVSYRNTGDLAKALESFDKALKAEPGHWQALFNEVIVYGIDKGDTARGRALLAELRKLQATHPEIPPLERLEESMGGAKGDRGTP